LFDNLEWLSNKLLLSFKLGKTMELTLTQTSLVFLTGWVWLWVAKVTRDDLPRVILVQQRMGISTARMLHRLMYLSRLLIIGVVSSVLGIGLLTGMLEGAAVGLLAMGITLLTYIHWKVSVFLHPRVLESLFQMMERGGDQGPEEPLPAA
jgi:hypothetical protein